MSNISRRDAFFILFSLLLIGMMLGPIREVIRYALDLEHTNASQIILIPFISAALLYQNRRNIFRNVQYSPVPGIVVMIAGTALLAAGATWGHRLDEGDRLAVMIASFVVLWLGGFLWFYGTTVFRTALFPLLFLFFCLPIASPVQDRIIEILRRGSTDVAEVLLKLFGTPVYRQGFVLTLPDLVIEVAPECSGIRSGISLLILSLLVGHLMLRTVWRRITLLVAAVPILIFKNALRIGVLSFLTIHFDKRIMTSRLHTEGGIPFFAIGLLLMYPILLLLVKSEGRTPVRRLITREVHP